MLNNLEKSLLNYDTLVELIEDDFVCANIAGACKQDFLFFYKIMFILQNGSLILSPPCIIQMAKELQEVAEKQHSLVINCPPGYGKTQMVTYWMAWCFIRNKEVHFLYVNCIFKSVKQRGSELKNILRSHATYRLFNLMLSSDSKSNELFRLDASTARSGYVGVSYKGGATGLDAGNAKINGFGGGLVIDDPLSAGQINSEASKLYMHEQYKNMFASRPRGQNCPIVIVAQRLCIDDLFATIKEEEEAGVRSWKWCVIPALDENDTSTFEEKLPTKQLLALKAMYSMRQVFTAQYQQHPIQPSGEIIKAEWFKYHDGNIFERRSMIREVFITADTAIGKGKGADYTVFCLWFLIDEGLLLLDMVRGRWNATEQVKNAREFYRKHYYASDGSVKHYTIQGCHLNKFLIEDTLHGKAVIDMIKNSTTDIYVPVYKMKPEKDKLARVQDAVPYIESGYVYLPAHRQDILNLLLQECIKFSYDDTHEHDDIVDCLSYAIRESIINRKHYYRLPYDSLTIKN